MFLWERITILLLSVLTIAPCIFHHHSLADANPVQGSARTVREVYPEIEPEKSEAGQAEVCVVGDLVYGADETVPAEQPCLKCKCSPPGVHCETVRCQKRPGCKVVHKLNECCPDYQCECYHEGKKYANGERLETAPGGECRVCYCRGGEVQCINITCYQREDCEGTHVAGQCCPKYDHCPPKEAGGKVYTTTTTTVSQPTTNSEVTPTSTLSEDPTQNENKIAEDGSTPTSFDFSTVLPPPGKHIPKSDQPKITIQEIIPEVKEIPMTPPPKREISDKNHMIAQSPLTINGQNFTDDFDQNDLTNDTNSESSEISLIFREAPPVLKIGDKFVFLKESNGSDDSKKSPVPVITVVGAEGLQRGVEENAEAQEPEPFPGDPTPTEETESKKELLVPEPSSHILSLVKDRYGTPTRSPILTLQEFVSSHSSPKPTEADDFFPQEVDNNISIITENILNKIKEITNPDTTTSVEALVQKIHILDVNDTLFVNKTTDSEDEVQNATISELNNSTSSTITPELSTSSRYQELGEHNNKEEEVPLVEQNPEYPPIPDIMSLPNIEEIPEVLPELENASSTTEKVTTTITSDTSTKTAMKILPDVLELRNNKSIDTNSSGLPLEWLKLENNSSEEIIVDGFTEEPITLEPDDVTTPKSDTIISEMESQIILSSSEEKTTIEPGRSIESVEMTTEDSGEYTTQFSNETNTSEMENASVESQQIIDKADLVEMLPNFKNASSTFKSIENTKKPHEEQKNITMVPSLMADVELIDPLQLSKPGKEEKPDKVEEAKVKRSQVVTNADENIFEELNSEAVQVVGNKLVSIREEKDDDEIFKELMRDAESTLSPIASQKKGKLNDSPQLMGKETEVLQRVSDAISKFQLKESSQSLDASILGILKDFFSSQNNQRRSDE